MVPSETMTSDVEAVERGAWGGKIEFLLTCIGFSVGLGNIWRFPYLTYENGGGAFILPYLLFLVLLGIPMYTLELCFGQFASLGPTATWRACPLFKGIGVATLTVSWYIMIYFNVIISWALFYLFSSFTKNLPWTSCDNAWNTPSCLVRGGNVTFTAFNTTPAEEFYYREVLQRSAGIEHTTLLNWRLALLLLLTWIIVFMVMLKGVSSLGKVSYVVSTFPYVLLTVFLIRGVTLPGAQKGILYYLTPDFKRLAEPKVWCAAATQIFYSTGVCMGTLVAMSSYNKFHNKVLRDGFFIPLINSATSIYAGFVIFSVLGFMAHEQGREVPEVVAQGPGLVFVVYPEGLSQMPLPQLWAVLFFLMMTFIGFSSQFSYGETLISAVQDEWPMLRRSPYAMLFRATFCIVSFFCGLPMVTDSGFYIFSLLNDYSAGYPLLIIGLTELLALNYVYGFQRFSADIFMMVGRKPNIYIKACWMAVTPVVVLSILIFFMSAESDSITVDGILYPKWGFTLAWLIAGFPLFLIFFVGLVTFCRKGGYQALKATVVPEFEWGPARPEHRTGRYARADDPPEGGFRTNTKVDIIPQYQKCPAMPLDVSEVDFHMEKIKGDSSLMGRDYSQQESGECRPPGGAEHPASIGHDNKRFDNPLSPTTPLFEESGQL